jgi:hypothetical protein
MWLNTQNIWSTSLQFRIDDKLWSVFYLALM